MPDLGMYDKKFEQSVKILPSSEELGKVFLKKWQLFWELKDEQELMRRKRGTAYAKALR